MKTMKGPGGSLTVDVNDCRDCPAHWTNTEYPKSACLLEKARGRRVSFGFGGHHASVTDRNAGRSIPDDCPLQDGPVQLRLAK